MERLLAGFSALGWREYLFAAGMAYVLTYIYRVFQRRKESGKNKEKTYVIQTFDKRAIDRCKELFPIDVLSFKGKEFKRGMQIRITTIQQNVIVGEFIGLNRVNLVCIKTGNKIIAHQLLFLARTYANILPWQIGICTAAFPFRECLFCLFVYNFNGILTGKNIEFFGQSHIIK